MGLDMFLSRSPKMENEVGYWRKANHIHEWFVENVQDGIDDCGIYPVTKDQLHELYNLCKKVKELCILVDGTINDGYSYSGGVKTHHTRPGKVLANPDTAADLLPTQDGFFFGSTDYDEYYMQDIESTIDIIEPLLEKEEQDTFYYQSSW